MTPLTTQGTTHSRVTQCNTVQFLVSLSKGRNTNTPPPPPPARKCRCMDGTFEKKRRDHRSITNGSMYRVSASLLCESHGEVVGGLLSLHPSIAICDLNLASITP